MKKFLFLLILLIPLSFIYAEKVAVIGFINNGDKTEDDYNYILSSSIFSFLYKISDIDTTDKEIVNKITLEKKFFNQKFDPERALNIGLSLSASKIITGEYTVNKKNKKINISLYVYNVKNGELELKRNYIESTGADIFDGIDKINQALASHLLSRVIEIGRLSITIDTSGDYELYLNGKFQKIINKNISFNETIIASENIKVVLNKLPSKEMVFSKEIKVNKGETYNLVYSPSANLIINLKGFEEGDVLINNTIYSKIPKENPVVTISNIQLNKNIKIGISREKKILAEKNITLTETRDYLLDFSKDKDGTLSDNSKQTSNSMQQYLLGLNDGKLRAKQTISGWLWLGGTFLASGVTSSFLSILGLLPGGIMVALAFNLPPALPQDELLGKDINYVRGYKEGFYSEIKNINLINSSIGCCIGSMAGNLVFLIIISQKSK
ncbi:MAG: hypothetical protein N2258_01725 [Brevinematales bacterium]|nr:hypothetical protein [Brevinematales bacterium]